MVELKCANRGGPVSAGHEEVFVGDAAAVVRRDSALHCSHWGGVYASGEELPLAMNTNIDVHQEIGTVETGGRVVGVHQELGDPK